MLLPAGTLVDVSKDTADVILKLGRCVVVPEKAEDKAEEIGEPEAVEKVEKPSRKKGAKKD